MRITLNSYLCIKSTNRIDFVSFTKIILTFPDETPCFFIDFGFWGEKWNNFSKNCKSHALAKQHGLQRLELADI